MRPTDSQSLAVGFFDGVHIGHRAILARAEDALTFSNHPISLLDAGRKPRLIMSLKDRIDAIKDSGVKEVRVLDFTPELAAMPPADFVRRYILSPGYKRVVCGQDWRFGKGGEGDAGFLRSRGVEVEEVPYARYDGERVSSSRIRRTLENGDIAAANQMLSRRFKIAGKRFSGKKVGSALGFPTVNLIPADLEVKIPLGVYEAYASGVKALVNYGYAPTMGRSSWQEPVVEVHLLSAGDFDFSEVELVSFLRPERKFASLDELQRQIKEDLNKVEL